MALAGLKARCRWQGCTKNKQKMPLCMQIHWAISMPEKEIFQALSDAYDEVGVLFRLARTLRSFSPKSADPLPVSLASGALCEAMAATGFRPMREK
jgi:hypothetical protein